MQGSSPSVTPHPRDLEVQDWSSYDLVIDARSPREFAEDHIPGALNLPVVIDEEYAAVGTLHRTDTHAAYVLGVEKSLRNIADDIAVHIAPLKRTARILVYCFRGGKRSELWSSALRIIGFKVDVLRGGWKAYREWVRNSLDILPRGLCMRVIAGATGTGKTRMLVALRQLGEQVLDLEAIAVHRGSILGGVPGQPQPSQKLFDSKLVEALRAIEQGRRVWVESESKKIGRVQLPLALYEAMSIAPVIVLEAPLEERVQLWHEEYPNLAEDPTEMVTLLGSMRDTKALVGKEVFARWERLAAEGDTNELFASVITHYYDPLYERSLRRGFSGMAQAVRLRTASVSPIALADCAMRAIQAAG